MAGDSSTSPRPTLLMVLEKENQSGQKFQGVVRIAECHFVQAAGISYKNHNEGRKFMTIPRILKNQKYDTYQHWKQRQQSMAHGCWLSRMWQRFMLMICG